MSEYCSNKLSERFKNKIPQFLAHLNIWNKDTMHDCAATPRAYHKALKKQQKKHAVCVICGKVFEKGKYQKTRTTCSRSCGCKLGAIHRNEKMSKRRAENAIYKNQETK